MTLFARFPFRTVFLFTLLTVLSAAAAQHRLPADTYTLQPGALEIHSQYWSDTYIFGLGWSSGADLPDPVIIGEGVSVSREVLDLVTGVSSAPPKAAPRRNPFEQPAEPPAATPTPQPPRPAPAGSGRISGVRFGGGEEVRIVFDIEGLTGPAALEPLAGTGTLEAGGVLTLPLGGLRPPERERLSELGVSVEFSGGLVRVTPGGGAAWRVFPLGDPVRLVIDLQPQDGTFVLPDELAAPVTIGQRESRVMSPGITYQQFEYPNGRSTSRVHVLEISPGAGRLGVVGQSRSAAPLGELARGSLAAINAGYFNTGTHDHIGLLRVDGEIDSLPSLGRASIGFNGSQAYMARTKAEITVVLDGFRRLSAEAGRLGIEISETPGVRAGDRGRGVLIVRDGHVTANRLGPLTVPEDGYALAYNPELRELALLEPGDTVSYSLEFQPAFFDRARYAVEAGPLLVDGGEPAFQPERETFARGQRILDEYTSQSAVGIRPDGTLLFVVAETMRAQDLVPLFQSLGAGQAMRLDSGGSAALYADGRVLNRYNQRRIVSAIVVLPH